MGSVSSRIWPKSFFDDEEFGATTPAQPSRRRKLPFDPRSTTDEICRTPIMVESTPNCLPYQNEMEPRSPAYGFQRTPMISTHDTLDPRSPSCNIPRTPVDDLKHEFPDIVEGVAVETKEEEKLEEEPQTAEGETGKIKVLAVVHPNSPAQKQRRPKLLFVDDCAKARSPLAITNANSNRLRIRTHPRIASKQVTTDLGSPKKGPAWPSEDKENSPLFITNM